jgi:hypothetical protein
VARGVSSLAALLVLWPAPGWADAGARELPVDPGVPAVMLVTSPKGRSPTVSGSEILRMASEMLRERTDLRLLSPEQAELEQGQLDLCSGAGRLGCWTRACRPDYQRLLLDEVAADAPFEALKGKLDRTAPAFLFVVLVVPEAKGDNPADRVSWLLIDLEYALRELHQARRSRAAEGTEDAIFSLAVASVMGSHAVSAASQLHDELAKAIEQFQPLFERAGHWLPYGEIDLVGGGAGHQIEVDGQLVGESGEAGTRLVRVRPGRRAVRLVPRVDAALQPFATSVEVSRDQPARVRADLIPLPGTSSVLRSVSLWGGLGLVAAGATMVVRAAIPASDPQPVDVCFEGHCPAQRNGYFRTFCDLAHPTAPCGGVMVAPLGFSLVGAGAVWAGGALMSDPTDDGSPWLRMLVGVGLGAVGYGISALASGH